MISNNMSSMGYLMELLTISIKELSNIISIERSSVSKWKNGTRILNIDSPHFEPIVKYFVAKNEKLGSHLLYDFFAVIYPEADNTVDKYIENCIRRFLQNKSISNIEDNHEIKYTNCLYSTDIMVYKGVEGRKNAVTELLNFAEKTTPSSIFIYEREQLKWAINDTVYINKFIAQLTKLLNMGHKITCIFTLEINTKNFRQIYLAFLPMFFNENYSEYIIPSSSLTKKINTSLYILKDKMLVTGIDNDKAPSNLYSCLYRDIFSINSHFSLMENFIQTLSPQNRINCFVDKNRIINVMDTGINKNEPTCYYGKTLSFTTMSEGLYEYILNENRLPKTDKERCLNIYHNLRKNIENNPIDLYGGYYLFLDDIIAGFKTNKIVNFGLTALCKKKVVITKKQYLNHYNDTIELIKKNPKYRIILNYGSYDVPCLAWIKRNLWGVLFYANSDWYNSKLIANENADIVNTMILNFEELFTLTPAIFKDNDYVADVFKKIMDEN